MNLLASASPRATPGTVPAGTAAGVQERPLAGRQNRHKPKNRQNLQRLRNPRGQSPQAQTQGKSGGVMAGKRGRSLPRGAWHLERMAPRAKIPVNLLASASLGATLGTVPASTAAGVQERPLAGRQDRHKPKNRQNLQRLSRCRGQSPQSQKQGKSGGVVAGT